MEVGADPSSTEPPCVHLVRFRDGLRRIRRSKAAVWWCEGVCGLVCIPASSELVRVTAHLHTSVGM